MTSLTDTGTQEIGFPDETTKLIYPNGEERTSFADGTVQTLTANGDRYGARFPTEICTQGCHWFPR
jgi:hypothetical protein